MLPKIAKKCSENTSNDKNDPNKIDDDYYYKLNFDGCSKGNPGIAGAGAVIYYLNEEYYANYLFLGKDYTNNHAEYAGLILGLQQAKEFGIKRLKVEGDSLLVINQMKGTYKCKSSNLLELYERAKELEAAFDKIEYNHVFRNKNKRADQLSNMAIEEYLTEIE
jgi:ribonuclease HI